MNNQQPIQTGIPRPSLEMEHSHILQCLLMTDADEQRTLTGIHNRLQSVLKSELRPRLEQLVAWGYLRSEYDCYLLTTAGRERAQALHTAQAKHSGGQPLYPPVVNNYFNMRDIGGGSNLTVRVDAPPASVQPMPQGGQVPPLHKPALPTPPQNSLPAPGSSALPAPRPAPAPQPDLKLVDNVRQTKGLLVSGFHPWRRMYPLPTAPNVNARIVRFCFQLARFPDFDPCGIVDGDILGREGHIMPTTGDLTQDDLTVSRKHAQFLVRRKVKNYEIQIKDLNSRAGIYIDGKPIPPDRFVEVKPGATIRMGRLEIIVTELARNWTSAEMAQFDLKKPAPAPAKAAKK